MYSDLLVALQNQATIPECIPYSLTDEASRLFLLYETFNILEL